MIIDAIEAEQAVLGSMLMQNQIIDIIKPILFESDFIEFKHQKIYKALLAINEEEKPADEVTVGDFLKSKNILEKCGGIVYLAELLDYVPTTGNAEFYAKIVRDKSIERQADEASQELHRNIKQLGSKEANRLFQERIELLQARQREDRGTSIKDLYPMLFGVLEERSSNPDGISGLTTGIQAYDDLLNGMYPTELHVIAAGAKVGKSAAALIISDHASKQGKGKVLFFSLEMGKEQVGFRHLSYMAKVDSKKFRKGDLQAEDWDKVALAIEEADKNKNLIIFDNFGATVQDIIADTMEVANREKIALIVVDYVQRLAKTNHRHNEAEKITEAMQKLKTLTQRANAPILALAQINREGRKSQEPRLYHLDGSSSIEKEASSITFLWRPDEERQGELELIMEANRDGSTGRSRLFFDGSKMRFKNY